MLASPHGQTSSDQNLQCLFIGISIKDLKNELLHPTPLKMKMDCGRSRVRSSGPAIFFREDKSWNHFYGHYFSDAIDRDIDIEILFFVEYCTTWNISPVGLLFRQTRVN